MNVKNKDLVEGVVNGRVVQKRPRPSLGCSGGGKISLQCTVQTWRGERWLIP